MDIDEVAASGEIAFDDSYHANPPSTAAPARSDGQRPAAGVPTPVLGYLSEQERPRMKTPAGCGRDEHLSDPLPRGPTAIEIVKGELQVKEFALPRAGNIPRRFAR
jgi:hypothetical protein